MILIFLVNMPGFSKAADDYEQLYMQARQLEEKNCFKEAATEYKRYIFMTDYSENSGNYTQDSYFALARIYEAEKDFTLAGDYMKKAMNLAMENTELSAEQFSDLMCIHVDFLSRKAEAQKYNLETDPEFMYYFLICDKTLFTKLDSKTKYAYLRNLALTSQWEVLQNEFIQINQNDSDLFSKEELKVCLQNIEKILEFKPKKPSTAACLSIIPGLGQLYAGEYEDALNAFLLNGSLIALSVYSCSTLNLFDFALLELSPVIRFYRGNIQNARKETINWNNNKLQEFSKPVLQCISNANSKI